MDYEKSYKDANNKVAARFGTNVAKEIFADLYESEDEKIREELIRYLPYCDDISKDTKERWIAWLEKQGEKSDYNTYKATIESIAAMVEKYANGDLKDFYDNIKVKCKDAIEYDNTWIKKQDDYNRLVEEIKKRKELLSKEKAKQIFDGMQIKPPYHEYQFVGAIEYAIKLTKQQMIDKACEWLNEQSFGGWIDEPTDEFIEELVKAMKGE